MATKTQLINHNLSSLSGGVTEQFQEGRYDSQVSEMINCIPSITRGVMRRNPLEHLDILSGLAGDITDYFIYTYDRGTAGEQYVVVLPGDGSIHTYDANDGSLITTETGKTYLIKPLGTKAKDIFKALTIGDYTFIVNTIIKVHFTVDTFPTAGYSNMAFYWIKKTTSVISEQYQNTGGASGAKSLGYTYTLNGYTLEASSESRPNQTAYDKNTSYKIAEEIKTNSVTSLAPSNFEAFAYDTSFSGSDWKWSDTFGDEASLGVWKTVDDADKLPVNMPSALDGFIVKVTGNTASQLDDYYLQYDYGERTWTEIPAPGIEYKLDANTMPHVLYRLTNGSFKLDTYQGVSADGLTLDGVSQWGDRATAGEEDLDDPSFVGTTISNIFFHKNRLGFLTRDNVILSRTGSYGDFFPQTIQEILDDDPIDLAVASTDVTVLRHAVPTSGQLLLFSDDNQFKLDSIDGPLTPNSVDITEVSGYTYSSLADAQAIGNKIFFSNRAGNSSQLYSYAITDFNSSKAEASQMTIHLPTYITGNVTHITGHDVLGQIFVQQDGNSKELVVLSSVIRGNEELQNAFHKWIFEEDIVHTSIINNDLYIIFSTGSLCKMSLEIPANIDNVTYTDTYNNVDGAKEFLSKLTFSEFFIRDGNGKGTVRGRYQLRTIKYTVTDNSYYMTSILDSNNNLFNSETMYGTTWADIDTWDDSKIWVEIDPAYTREYIDDDLVTILADSKRVTIQFSNSTNNPTKGFELATANIEGLFHQRSLRR